MSKRTTFACIAIALAVALALAPTPTPASAITSITLSPNTTTPAPRSPLVVTARVDTSPAGLRASYRWQRKAGARWVDITRLPWLSITYFTASVQTFRLVATLPGGASATSREITITWGSPPTPTWTPTPIPTATPTPTPTATPTPTPTPATTTTVTIKAVSVTAGSTTPAVGASTTLAASVVTDPANSAATYKWQKKVGSAWSNLTSTGSRISVQSSTGGATLFRVIASPSSGSSITSSEITITWGGTAPTTPTTYADLISAPGPAFNCRSVPLGGSIRRVKRNEDATSHQGHQARVEIWAGKLVSNLDLLCVEARFVSESTPGALHNSWGGSLHQVERSIPNVSVSGILNLSFGGFRSLYSHVHPSRNALPDREVTPVKCNTCRGGTLQTKHSEVALNYFKGPVLYAYGEHSYTTRNSSTLIHTSTDWTTPIKGAPTACGGGRDGSSGVGECFIAIKEEIEAELLRDLDSEIVKAISDTIVGWVRGSS